MIRLQKNKVMILLCILAAYILLAGVLLAAVSMGIIQKALPPIAEIVSNDTIALCTDIF